MENITCWRNKFGLECVCLQRCHLVMIDKVTPFLISIDSQVTLRRPVSSVASIPTVEKTVEAVNAIV